MIDWFLLKVPHNKLMSKTQHVLVRMQKNTFPKGKKNYDVLSAFKEKKKAKNTRKKRHVQR